MIVKKYPLESKSNDAKRKLKAILQNNSTMWLRKINWIWDQITDNYRNKINAILIEQKTFNKLTAKFNWNNITELLK